MEGGHNLGYIIHEIFHFLIGATVIYLFINENDETIDKRALIMVFGGIAAISPDMTKFFGDILGHSIWFAPVFGLLLSIIFQFFYREIPFLKSWGIFSLSVLIGHIFVDYIGNGVALFYPILKKEYSLNLIVSTDNFILYLLLILLLICLFYKKGKTILLAGILMIALYLGGLTASKYYLEKTLKQQYENIDLLLTFRNHNFLEWNFIVRTNEVWVNGVSSILNQDVHLRSERKVD